ncbi:unnamed protein product [Periconia digitata]|uniref:Uncharacterized protein n=1 Tax=Periconia digitata TaxID=1303443 RepID=A0A9W4U862_9PLEO|nr:unnamed protein product [Periconia digitata]
MRASRPVDPAKHKEDGRFFFFFFFFFFLLLLKTPTQQETGKRTRLSLSSSPSPTPQNRLSQTHNNSQGIKNSTPTQTPPYPHHATSFLILIPLLHPSSSNLSHLATKSNNPTPPK